MISIQITIDLKVMLDKFFNKKKKEVDFFAIPQKKINTDTKITSKLGPKALQELIADQDKYIALIIQNMDQAKKQYFKLQDKIDQLNQKNQVINAQISRMTNQHQELTIKFDNLQNSLQILSSQSQRLFSNESKFALDQQLTSQKLKNLEEILKIYRDKSQLCKKIQQQNKVLKERFTSIQDKYNQILEKHQQHQKQKGYHKFIPDLMQGLQDLKRARKFSDDEPKIIIKKQVQTMTTEQYQVNQKLSPTQLKNCTQCKKKQRIQEQHILKISQIQQILEQQKESNLELKKRIRGFQQHVEGLQQDLNKLKASNQKLAKKLQQKKKQIQQLQKKYENQEQLRHQKQKNNLKSQQGMYQDLQKTIQELRQKLKIKQSQIVKLKQQLDSQIQAKINEKNQQQKRFKKQKFQYQEMFDYKLRQLQNKYKNAEEQLLSLRSILNEFQRDKKIMEGSLQTYQKRLTQISKQRVQKQQKINQLCIQNENLKKNNKRISQEKEIIQQSSSSNLTQLNQKFGIMLSQKQLAIRDRNKMSSQLDLIRLQIKNKKVQIETFTTTINKLNNQMTQKMMNSQNYLNQLKDKQKIITKKEQDLNQAYQQLKSKQRKYEYELNQQRIKNDNMKRTITNNQTKLEQNKTSLNKFYQDSVHKDKKICIMEVKLKQYKHMIQTLRKEKVQMQKSYEQKIKGYQETIHEANQEDSTQQNKQLQRSKQDNYDQNDTLKSQLISFEQINQVLKEQNQNLRDRIKQLEEKLDEKEKVIKNLQEKRQQTIKEIEKLNLRSLNRPQVKVQSSEKSVIELRAQRQEKGQELKQLKQKTDQRIKKIAGKAYKGFDILLKQHQNLYKDFINVFMKDLSQKQEVKNIQSEINVLIKKSTDMKDVFQDYI